VCDHVPQALGFPFIYQTGTTAFTGQVLTFNAPASKVGIDISLDGQPQTAVFSLAGVCPTTPPCNYGLAGYAGLLFDYGQYKSMPTGDDQFREGNVYAGATTQPRRSNSSMPRTISPA
jgi:peptide/nickel transport system substrate-binding protein